MNRYAPRYFQTLEAIDDRHFWFRARNFLISRLAGEIAAARGSQCRVLEIGCGNGNALRWVRKAFPDGTVIGMDLFTDALRSAGPRAKCHVVTGDIALPPFERSFDVIAAFDVLEHLPDDLRALENIRNMLVPGGQFLITVPAHRVLWSYFDEASHHCRRYELDELRTKLTATGFRITFLTYYMATMYPLIYIGRKLAGVWGRKHVVNGEVHRLAAQDLRVLPVVNTALAQLLTWECRYVARRRTLPVGASLLAIAQPA